MNKSQLVVIILVAAAAALGVTAMYSLATMRIDLASYAVLALGGVATALLYALQYVREDEDHVAASALAQAQCLAMRK